MEEARARLDEDKAHGLRDLAFVGLAAALGEPGLPIRSVGGSLETALELPALESVLADLDASPQAALARADVEAARARYPGYLAVRAEVYAAAWAALVDPVRVDER